jgi:CheY-like chemotaxis protein
MQDSNPILLQAQPFQHTLLQIEDNQANALLVEMMLAERSDLKLLTAINGYQGIRASGHQGISMASSHKPDIILMDINMPDIGCLAALKILRENPATAPIPVIALSSNAYPRQIEEGLKAGFFLYLTKPFKLDDLMGAIDVALLNAAENLLTN